jgi:hypothetical protein
MGMPPPSARATSGEPASYPPNHEDNEQDERWNGNGCKSDYAEDGTDDSQGKDVRLERSCTTQVDRSNWTVHFEFALTSPSME